MEKTGLKGEPPKQGVKVGRGGNLGGRLGGASWPFVWPKDEPFGPAGSSVRGRNGYKTGGEPGGTGLNHFHLFQNFFHCFYIEIRNF